MRSQLAARLGVQVPQIHHLPPDVHSLDAAVEAIELADAYLICDGNPLAESQKITLRGALGEREDGSWAATRVGDFGPRQGTGKNDKIAARELAGLLLFGERLQIHTAHEFPTANEAFLRMVAVFENWDDLRRRVARIRYANGEQGIEFLSGQRLKYRARTGGSGRGFAKADLLVYDEAQHLVREHLAASAPSKLANPNSQTWYAGSGGLSTSVVAWAMRRAAVLGTGGRLAYTEMTGERFEVVNGKILWFQPSDPLDRDVWYRAMPGLGRWVSEESMLALYEDLGADPALFAREGLCVWDPEPGMDGGFLEIAQEDWEACADDKSGLGERFSFALDVAEDRKWAAIGVAGPSGRGGTHVELTSDHETWDYRPGTDWVVGRAKALHDKWGRPFAVVKGSPAWSLEADLAAAGVGLLPVTPQEFAQACGQFYDAAVQHSLKHLNQPALTAAVAGLARRSSGDAFVWDRRNATVDISPAVAVTVAKFASDQHDDTPESGLVDPNDGEDDDEW